MARNPLLSVQPAFTGARLKAPPMPASRIIFAALLIGFLAGPALAVPGQAADAAYGVCLDKAEQRAVVASHGAVRLAQAIKTLRAQGQHAEVLRARLCRGGAGLVYLLTLLDRNGKVIRATVDARNGALMNGR
jgi:hypothetical protein